MQAKILDFASDKIVSKLNKIDKQDIKNVLTKVGSKFARSEKNSQKDAAAQGSTSQQTKEKVNEDVKLQAVGVERPEDKTDKPDNILEIEKDNLESEGMDESSTDDENLETDPLNPDDPNAIEPARCEKDKMKSGEVQNFIQKKNMAQGMMDLALVSANCNQLRYVLDMSTMHPYFFTSLCLIISSLALQVIVGICLLYSNSYNLKRKAEMRSADKFNNFSIYGVFLITLTNFLISAFSGTNTSLAGPGADAKDEPMVEQPAV